MLVWRRAGSARSLLAAAAAAALIATVLLAGLTEYNSAVVTAGGQSAVAAAPAQERSLLVKGPIDNEPEFTQADTKLHSELSDGIGGAKVGYAQGGFASGRQFTGNTGEALGDANHLVFASVMFLDGLDQYAKLVEGGWAEPGKTPAQAVVGKSAAAVLHLKVGDRVPITDRRTDKVTEIVVAGIFEAKAQTDAYWQLAPELERGNAPGLSTYGPVVLSRSDFFSGGWASDSTGGWVVQPQLAGTDLVGLIAVRKAVRDLPKHLREALGFGSSGQVTTSLDALVDRLQRADLVGRSALLTPLLLIVVLGGYALMLLASLLTEQRRAETALLRARGAARSQLAGLATREALLVALPAAVLAPPIVVTLLSRTNRLSLFQEINLRMNESFSVLIWEVGAAAALGCLLAMLVPALRGGGTYVADLAARSRPSKATVIQRAGVDVVLVGFAVLAWVQLRQYQSPLSGPGGQLGIDPLLAAAAPVGVLAGAVLALRVLPLLTGLAERLIDRRPWFSAQLGMWQAGRRPHAGPVLLLALAVAVSTLAWSLAATSERSLTDQANHTAGADFRLTETSGFAPRDRSGELAQVPGLVKVLPGWRNPTSIGEKSTPAVVMGFDAAAAVDVLHLRGDLGDKVKLLGELASRRVGGTTTPLPDQVTELSGQLQVTIQVSDERVDLLQGSGLTVVFVDDQGGQYRVPLAQIRPDGKPHAFQTKLPVFGQRVSLANIYFDGTALYGDTVSIKLTDLSVTGPNAAKTPVDLTGTGWHGTAESQVTAGKGTLSLDFVQRNDASGWWAPPPFLVTVSRGEASSRTVPGLITADALAALHGELGQNVNVPVGGMNLSVRIVGVVPAMPGADGLPAVLIDLPSATAVQLQSTDGTQSAQEWWVSADPAQHDATAAALAKLSNLKVADAQAIADVSNHDPYGVGARVALFAAALGAMLLALVGVAVDVRATARRRVSELAVLHTLGANARQLARALITEQAFLAGLGVAVGLVVGIGVAATMAPLVILTPTADRPIPIPLLEIAWQPVLGTAALLLVIATGMAGLVATTMRQRLAAAQLRIGADR